MTREEALAELAAWNESGDFERAHYYADEVLCNLLRSLGYEDVVEAFEAIGKWYA